MSLIEPLAAYHLALDLVKKAGFTLAHAASNSESCYYEHPSRPGLLLRLSMHKNKGSPIGLGGIVARMTFSKKDHTFTPTQVRNMVAWAIGNYFLRDPEPSKYDGKKGTWEQSTRRVSVRQEGRPGHDGFDCNNTESPSGRDPSPF